MAENYPIIQVQPEWALEPEDMGTKEKVWYRRPGEGQMDWLYKRPRPSTGEHWAEKIAAEVASELGVAHARIELAEFGEERGSASESFVPDDHDVFHGNQLLERMTPGYDPTAKRRLSEHSFANIWRSFGDLFVTRQAAEETRGAFAGQLVLDAVIGNTDRHHENWGLLRMQVGEHESGGLAPSFDHASSLGRELQDRKRGLLLVENRVGAYSDKARGEIFWSEEDRRPPSPLELVRKAAMKHLSHFGPTLERVGGLRHSRVTEIVNRIPDNWMSPVARAFAIELISYNRRRLMELGK